MKRSQTHSSLARHASARALIGAFSIAWVASTQAQIQAPPPETIASPAFDRMVCRLYFGPLEPRNYSGGQWRDATHPLQGYAPEQIADRVADIGTEVWALGRCELQTGTFWPSQMVKRSDEVPPDYLARLVRRSKERGMRVHAQLGMTANDFGQVEAFNEWASHPMDRSKKTDPTRLSPFSPYREWKGRYLAEYCRVLGVDGFTFDAVQFVGGPDAAFGSGGDVGPYGQAAYKRDTGRDVPAAEDWGDLNFKQWVNWRYGRHLEFFQDVTAPSVEFKPHATSVINYYTWGHWHLGHPLRRLGEINWCPQIEGETSLRDKIGRAMSPRTEVWDWGTWYIGNLAHGEFAAFNPDRAIARGLRVIAHGLCPNYGGLSIDIELWADSMKKVFTEYKKHRPYMGTDTVKYAGLVVSQQTRDFARHQGLGPFWDTLEGINEIHNHQHLLLDVIFDDSLVFNELSKYAVVLMPNVICLSDAQCESIREYVRHGGVLIAAMETSLHDEWGNKREDFALSDLFGVHYQSTDRLEGGEPLILVPQTEELTEQFGKLLAFTGPAVHVKRADDGGTDVLFTRSERQTLNGLWLTVDDYDSNEPAFVRNQVGDGTVYYLSADLGQAYLRTFLPQVAELLGHLMRTAATPPVEFNAPKALEVTAHWLDEKKMAVHLVNGTALLGMPPIYKPQDSEERRPFLFQMAPLADIGIKVNHGIVTRATATVKGGARDVQNNHVRIPSVAHGEVIILELE